MWPNVLAYHVTDGVRNSNSVTQAKKITMLNRDDTISRSRMASSTRRNDPTPDLVADVNAVSDG